MDTCSGDSGGPLLKWSEDLDTFVLHATLNGGGYDCLLNTTDGDGIWNSVFPHIQWINSFVRGKFNFNFELLQEIHLTPITTTTQPYDAVSRK